MAINNTTCSKQCFFTTQVPVLPTELWLDILGETSISEVEHLWISARLTSRHFKDHVERLFATTYLPCFAISLALPRRDPASGASKWPGAILNAQIVMTFDSVGLNNRYVTFVSPSCIRAGDEVQNLEELKDQHVLPKARLEEAKAWVYLQKYMSGLTMQLPRHIEWNERRKRWEWQLDWRKFVTRFYTAKSEARAGLHHKRRAANIRRG